MRSKKGFTMVEMIIVIAIIAVLAMVVIPAISGYIGDSKDNYNEKLVKQLEVSGKNYYSENKNELPNKEYNRIALISNTYVALPTLQSSNYVSKDFVDSRGVECKESYVYVMQPGGSTENEYHPCLICGDKNYTEDDPYCNISNWDDKTNPNCNLASEIGTDKDTIIKNGPNGTKIFYNPTSITITASDESGAAGNPGKVAYIIIEAYENGTDKMIDESTIDVSKMTSNEIKKINLMNYLPKDKKGQIITAEYRIKVLDEGGNQSSCLMNPDDNSDGVPTITVIYDKTKPKCELIDVQKNKDEKYITFDNTKTKDNWSKQDKLLTLIDEKEGLDKQPSYIIKDINYKYSLKEKADGTYYGYVKDEAGNIGTCDIPVKIKMFEDEKPYCLLFGKANINKYVKRDGKREDNAECYFYKGINGDYDLSKIELKDKSLGSIDPKINNDKNENKDNKIVIDIPFKVNNSGDGDESIVIKEGAVKVGNLTNDDLKVSEFYVDTTYPAVKWTTDLSQKYDSKTKTYYYEKGVKITATCTDTGSKVKSATISGKGTNITNATISDSQKSATITNNAKGKNLEYKVVCVDNAGNEKSYTNKYNVMEFSADPTCPCKTYKECETKDCGCKTGKRCPAAGCESGYYSYYWSDLRDSSSMEGSGGCIRCDNGCNYSCWNAYGSAGQGGRCTYMNGKTYQGRCLRTYICSYNYRNYSLCGCEKWKKCEDDACGCKTRKECWHY